LFADFVFKGGRRVLGQEHKIGAALAAEPTYLIHRLVASLAENRVVRLFQFNATLSGKPLDNRPLDLSSGGQLGGGNVGRYREHLLYTLVRFDLRCETFRAQFQPFMRENRATALVAADYPVVIFRHQQLQVLIKETIPTSFRTVIIS
jgi:hypothetical protein